MKAKNIQEKTESMQRCRYNIFETLWLCGFSETASRSKSQLSAALREDPGFDFGLSDAASIR
jgi:hypothetical protein